MSLLDDPKKDRSQVAFLALSRFQGKARKNFLERLKKDPSILFGFQWVDLLKLFDKETAFNLIAQYIESLDKAKKKLPSLSIDYMIYHILMREDVDSFYKMSTLAQSSLDRLNLYFEERVLSSDGYDKRFLYSAINELGTRGVFLIPTLIEAYQKKSKFAYCPDCQNILESIAVVSAPVDRSYAPNELKFLKQAQVFMKEKGILEIVESFPSNSKAIFSLGEEGAKKLIPLLNTLDSDLAKRRVDALAAMGPYSERLLASAAIHHEDWYVRSRSLQALGKMSFVSRETIFTIRKALKDSDPDVRQAAVQALGHLGGLSLDALEELEKIADSDSFLRVRAAAEKAIFRIELVRGASRYKFRSMTKREFLNKMSGLKVIYHKNEAFVESLFDAIIDDSVFFKSPKNPSIDHEAYFFLKDYLKSDAPERIKVKARKLMLEIESELKRTNSILSRGKNPLDQIKTRLKTPKSEKKP